MSRNQIFLLEHKFVFWLELKFWLRWLRRLRRGFRSRLLFWLASGGDFFQRNRRSLRRRIRCCRGNLGGRNGGFLVDLEFFNVRRLCRASWNGRSLGRWRGWRLHLWRGRMSFFQKRGPLVGQIHFLDSGLCRRGGHFDRLWFCFRKWRGWRTRGRSWFLSRGHSSDFGYAHLQRR